jgi:hypothetical protein
MDNNLFIPKTIRVGFQKRDDTFTGKLAYVIYFDAQGNLRQEKSWHQRRDREINFIDFENTPKPNFVLNKGVHRQGYFGSGRNVIRVYDQRDFEFEITVDNLLGILMHSDVSKRDIMEECVYAWSGKNLVLLPVNSVEYQNSVKHTEKQAVKMSTKDFVKGYTYIKKKSEQHCVYLGYYHFYEPQPDYVYGKDGKQYFTAYGWQKEKGKKHVFAIQLPETSSIRFEYLSPAQLGGVVDANVHDEYASILDEFLTSFSGAQVAKYEVFMPDNETIKKKLEGKIRLHIQQMRSNHGGNITGYLNNGSYVRYFFSEHNGMEIVYGRFDENNQEGLIPVRSEYSDLFYNYGTYFVKEGSAGDFLTRIAEGQPWSLDEIELSFIHSRSMNRDQAKIIQEFLNKRGRNISVIDKQYEKYGSVKYNVLTNTDGSENITFSYTEMLDLLREQNVGRGLRAYFEGCETPVTLKE